MCPALIHIEGSRSAKLLGQPLQFAAGRQWEGLIGRAQIKSNGGNDAMDRE